MADLSSFDLETGEPFPGTTGSPYLKVNDNYILNVWETKFCKSGNPRYAINICDDPAPTRSRWMIRDGRRTSAPIYCRGNPDNDTEVCEPDYPGDDDYYVTDIWGVRGQQQSVDYDEVDDVAELGIGEIPYSCLWAARGRDRHPEGARRRALFDSLTTTRTSTGTAENHSMLHRRRNGAARP